jgi:hypothetical protein
MRHGVVALDRCPARGIESHRDVSPMAGVLSPAMSRIEMSPDFRVSAIFQSSLSPIIALVANLSAISAETELLSAMTFLLTNIENRFDVGAGVIVFVAEKGLANREAVSATSMTLFLRPARPLALFLH